MLRSLSCFVFFFFNDTATTEIYTLSLHDALPISIAPIVIVIPDFIFVYYPVCVDIDGEDRKSTRLNSSHLGISYAVFCLKKKNHEYCLHYDDSYVDGPRASHV